MAPGKASISDLKSGSEPLRNAHLSVRLVQGPRIVVLTRTSEPFQNVAEIERCIEDFSKAVPMAGRAGWRIIIDMRVAPTRVHPALDPAFARFRKETQLGFLRAAVIVETPLGRVRAERLANTSHVSVRVVSSVEEAVGFLNLQ
jgi:hypothetical protein